jgi:hypothetical protein
MYCGYNLVFPAKARDPMAFFVSSTSRFMELSLYMILRAQSIQMIWYYFSHFNHNYDYALLQQVQQLLPSQKIIILVWV